MHEGHSTRAWRTVETTVRELSSRFDDPDLLRVVGFIPGDLRGGQVSALFFKTPRFTASTIARRCAPAAGAGACTSNFDMLFEDVENMRTAT
jgi:hypothetical protein